MRILLFSMVSNFKYGNTGIDYLAFHLRKSVVGCVDTKYFHHNENASEILKSIRFDYDIYAFSVFETNYKLAIDVATVIKEKNEGSIIVFGGQFVTMNYKQMVHKSPMIDYFVLGDGETPLMHIIDYHKCHKNSFLIDKSIAKIGDLSNKIVNVESDINRGACYDYYEYDCMDNNRKKTHCIMTKSNICAGACTFCCSRKGHITYKNTKKLSKKFHI